MAEDVLCVICRRYDAEGGYACRRCAVVLYEQLTNDIPHLHDALSGPAADEPTGYDPAPKYRDGRPERDYVGLIHPAGPTKAAANGPRVSGGSVEAPPPLDLTPVDLAAPIRPHARRLQARAALGLDDDQIGDLSVATELGGWVRDFAERRGETTREQLPTTKVGSMCRWLADRAHWAAREHEAVDEFADDVRRIRSRLRRVTGVTERDEEKRLPCPACDELWLVQPAGHDWIDCRGCGHHMSIEEYRRWSKTLAELRAA